MKILYELFSSSLEGLPSYRGSGSSIDEQCIVVGLLLQILGVEYMLAGSHLEIDLSFGIYLRHIHS